jgi:hypothetical protein
VPLLISCLGKDTGGGLFSYDGIAPEQIDTLSTTGIAQAGEWFGRLLWSSGETGSVGELLVARAPMTPSRSRSGMPAVLRSLRRHQVRPSPTYLINKWNVTRTARGPTTPITQTATDATSVSRYFKRSQSLSDVPVGTDAECSTIATELLAKHKDAMFRVTSVTFNLLDAATAKAVFRRELMDKITVKYTPPGGGSRISQDVFIQKIDIQGDNSGAPISATWGVSPL